MIEPGQNNSIVPEYCRNCGAEISGNFCSNCGQKRFVDYSKTVKGFLLNFASEFFNFDARFFRTLKYLLTRPGMLTHEFMEGRIERYVHPIKLYLFVSLVVFVTGSFLETDYFKTFTEKDSFYKPYIESAIQSDQISRDVYREKFNYNLEGKLPLYTIIMLVLFSLPLKLMYLPSKRRYTEHLVFAIHFFTFVLLSSLAADLISYFTDYDPTLFFMFVPPMIYLLISLKKVYHQGWLLSAGETVVLGIYYCCLVVAWALGSVFVTTLMT